jgi:hypothetical protein
LEAQMRMVFRLAVVFLLSLSAQAKPTAGRGVGAITCGVFAKMYKDRPGIEEEFFDWAQGLMTELNIASDDVQRDLLACFASLSKFGTCYEMPIEGQPTRVINTGDAV